MPTQALYSTWDCSPVSLPPRSRLCPIPPIGIGTPFVESLSGYVARLADAHAVSVGSLVVRELVTLVAGSRLFSSAEPDRFYARFNGVNSMGEPAQKWVKALQAGTTREDLHFLTLLPFKNLLWRLAIFRRRRAWCCACYEGDRAAGSAVYERLLWTLQPVRVCPQHQRRLEEVCPQCSQTSKPFTTYSRPGHCFKCQTWLGASNSEQDRPVSDRIPDEDLCMAEEVGRLLGLAPGLDSTSLRTTFAANFQACADYVAGGSKSSFANAAHVDDVTLRALISHDGRPRLATLLRISYHLSIPLTTCLDREPGSTPSSWAAARVRVLAGQRPPKPRPEGIRAALQHAASEQPPPRLCDVAARLGYVMPTRLYLVDGGLCRQIVTNYQKTLRPATSSLIGKQFCPPEQVKAALEESLAQELPARPEHIALKLGFANARGLYRKFPDLCEAIGEKIAKHKALQLAAMERALVAALSEYPPPSLSDLCDRLRCCRSAVLNGRFPQLCNQLLQNRRAHRLRQIEGLRQRLQEFSVALPAVSLEYVCRQVGLSRQQLIRLDPDGCAAIVAHFESSRRTSTQRKVEELNRQVRQIVTSLHQEGILPSVKRVRARLDKSISRNWSAVAATTRAVKAELKIGSTGSRSVA